MAMGMVNSNFMKKGHEKRHGLYIYEVQILMYMNFLALFWLVCNPHALITMEVGLSHQPPPIVMDWWLGSLIRHMVKRCRLGDLGKLRSLHLFLNYLVLLSSSPMVESYALSYSSIARLGPFILTLKIIFAYHVYTMEILPHGASISYFSKIHA